MNSLRQARSALGVTALFVFAACTAEGATNVSGYQYGTWSLAGSPYILTGQVTVLKSEPFTDTNGNGQWDPGELWTEVNGDGVWTADMPPLIMEPGTVVQIPRSLGINVIGTLIGGTTNVDEGGGTGDIPFVSFAAGSVGTLSGCTFDGVKVIIGSNDVTVTDSSLLSGVSVGGSRPTVTGCTIAGGISCALNFDLSGFLGNQYTGSSPAVWIVSGGTLNSSRTLLPVDGLSRFVFRSPFTVPAGVTLTIASATTAVIEPVLTTTTVAGAIHIEEGDGVTTDLELQGNNLSISSGGVLSAASGAVIRLMRGNSNYATGIYVAGVCTTAEGVVLRMAESDYSGAPDRRTVLSVSAGGMLEAEGLLAIRYEGNQGNPPSVDFAAGSVGTLSGCTFDGVKLNTGRGSVEIRCCVLQSLSLDSAAAIVAAYNDFSTGTVTVSGTAGATIDLANNWWGTTSPTQIAAKITDCHDQSSRPCLVFEPFLTEPGCVLLNEQLWASFDNTDPALGNLGTYELWTQSVVALSDPGARPLAQATDYPSLRFIFAVDPNQAVVANQALARQLVVLTQSARKAPAIDLGPREFRIWSADLQDYELYSSPAQTIKAPDAVNTGWLNLFVNTGYYIFPVYWARGLMWESQRTDMYAEVLVDAVLQPDSADSLSDDPTLIAQLDMLLSLEPVATPAWLYVLLTSVGADIPGDIAWTDFRSLLDDIGEATGYDHLGEWFSYLRGAISVVNRVQTVKADVARNLLLQTLADAEADRRLGAMEWAVSQMPAADPALVQGIQAARARFDAVSSEYYGRLDAVLDAVGDEGIIDWGFFIAEMGAEFSGLKVVVSGTEVSVGRVLLPYSLAWSVNGAIREQAFEGQRCCLAATIQRKLFEGGSSSIMAALQYNLGLTGPIDGDAAELATQLLQVNAYLSYYFYDRYLRISANTYSSIMGEIWNWILPGQPYDEFIADLQASRAAALTELRLLSGPKYLTTHANPVDSQALDREYEWLLALVATERYDPNEPYVRPLNADFTWSPDPVWRGQPVTFQPVETNALVSWQWDFGDSGTSQEQQPTHVFDSYGTLTVVLTATDVFGNERTKATEIHVAELAPVADFAIQNPMVMAGEPVLFTNLSSGTTIRWLWTFGDGNTSDEASPAHAYVNAGTYAVTLSAYGPDGQDTKATIGAVHVLGPVGFISVNSNLDTGSFRIVGPNGLVLAGAGLTQTYTDTPAGLYTITWNPRSGYSAPPQQMLSLNGRDTITFDGTYSPPPVPDATPPALTNSLPAQGSTVFRIHEIRVTVSEPVLVSSGDFILQNQDATVFSPSEITIVPGPGDMVELLATYTSHLPPGIYLARLRDAVLDMHENALDGDGDGLAGGDFNLHFTVVLVPGDFDGDVELDDLINFTGCMSGPDLGCPPSCVSGDFSQDGDADLADLAALQAMFGYTDCLTLR